MDFDDLWDDVNPVAVAGTYLFSLVLVVIMFKNLQGHALSLGVVGLIVVAVILLPISYVITRAIANKD